MVCDDLVEGSVCDVMQEAGVGLSKFFSNVAPATLKLSIIITSILIFMAIVLIVIGFLNKAKNM